jgi:hypothetical protein
VKQRWQTYYQADKVPQQAAVGKQTNGGCREFAFFTAVLSQLSAYCCFAERQPVARSGKHSPIARRSELAVHEHRTLTNSAAKKPEFAAGNNGPGLAHSNHFALYVSIHNMSVQSKE